MPGAARTAVASAAIATLAYNLLVAESTVPLVQLVPPAIVVAALSYAQYQVLHSTRESTAKNLTLRTSASLAWYSRRLCAGGNPPAGV